MIIEFAGHEIILDASGMAFWPSQQAGIVSDLHLEKGSHFARRGFFLPPYDSQETLERLLRECRQHTLQRLIILGDSFHDSKGFERLAPQAHELFHQLHEFNPVWIKGNHDAEFVPDTMKVYDLFELAGIVFRHQAEPDAMHEVSGHFHPKVVLNGGRLQRDCFVTDGNRLILPAFGAYTGGLSVQNPEIASLFKTGFDVYALGEKRVYRLTDV